MSATNETTMAVNVTVTVTDRAEKPAFERVLADWERAIGMWGITFKPMSMDKDDARQEAMVCAWKAYQSWDPARANFGTWVKGYIRGRMRNLRVRSAAEPAMCGLVVGDYDEEYTKELYPQEYLQEEMEEEGSGDEVIDMLSVMDRLPVEDRHILIRFFGVGCPRVSLVDLGKELAVSKQRIEQRKRAALVRLRKWLREREMSV